MANQNISQNARSTPTDSPAPLQAPKPELTEKERAALRWEKRHAKRARRIARNQAGYTARLQAHLATDSATFAALNGLTA